MKSMSRGMLVAGSALLAALPAQAASVVQCPSGAATCQINLDDGNTATQFSGSFSNGQVTNVPFTDVYGFNLGAGTASITFTSSSTGATNDIDFTSIELSGPGGVVAIPQVVADPSEIYQLNNFVVAAGAYTLRIAGFAGSPATFANGTYSGNVSFSPTSAVPEPSTWALMLGGFGLVGAGMRRTRKLRDVLA